MKRDPFEKWQRKHRNPLVKYSHFIAKESWLASKQYWLKWALRQTTTRCVDPDKPDEIIIDEDKIKAEIKRSEK